MVENLNGRTIMRSDMHGWPPVCIMRLVELVQTMNPQVCGKRKRSNCEGAHVKIWSRMMCLWKLPYWHKLKLRHNLDVMHIKKNICESLIATILNILEKTKDTVKARLDLKNL
jgi:ribulose kinase